MSAGLATTLAETTTTTTTSARSVLDKPLHELTEDDISQLTREDCRRYLQEKGMRRPSWNKSQAIQQVISLKSLLEPPPPSLPPNHPAPPPENPPPATSNSCSSFKELSQTDAEGSVSATEPLRESGCLQPAVDNKAVSPRSLDTTVLPPGQMTIFYSGKVNIYEGVPADRAQTILHVAASPFQFSHNEQSRPSSQWATSLSSHPSNVKFSVVHPHPRMSPPILTDVDGPTNRQVSLQKYLEKKKDRFKSRDRVGPPGLDMCLSHHIRAHGMHGQSSGSSINPTNQPGPHYPLPYLAENHSKNPRFSIDANDEAVSVILPKLDNITLEFASPKSGARCRVFSTGRLIGSCTRKYWMRESSLSGYEPCSNQFCIS